MAKRIQSYKTGEFVQDGAEYFYLTTQGVYERVKGDNDEYVIKHYFLVDE